MKGKIVVVLVDKEMTIKKPHVCFGCGQLFASRAHMRYINIADGPVYTRKYFCMYCCSFAEMNNIDLCGDIERYSFSKDVRWSHRFFDLYEHFGETDRPVGCRTKDEADGVIRKTYENHVLRNGVGTDAGSVELSDLFKRVKDARNSFYTTLEDESIKDALTVEITLTKRQFDRIFYTANDNDVLVVWSNIFLRGCSSQNKVGYIQEMSTYSDYEMEIVSVVFIDVLLGMLINNIYSPTYTVYSTPYSVSSSTNDSTYSTVTGA
jgi:hypothetical protein